MAWCLSWQRTTVSRRGSGSLPLRQVVKENNLRQETKSQPDSATGSIKLLLTEHVLLARLWAPSSLVPFVILKDENLLPYLLLYSNKGVGDFALGSSS